MEGGKGERGRFIAGVEVKLLSGKLEEKENTDAMKEKLKARQETKLCLCFYFLAIIPPSKHN